MGTSWGSFGMGGPDPATLAEAPAFEGDTTKPSANAQPYPTTSTPDSYVLQANDQSLPDGAGDQSAPDMVATTTPPSQPPVTYGSTPPTDQPTTPSPSAVATVSPQPQVGPYQTVPTANSDAPDTLASVPVASAPAAFGTTSRFSTNSSLSATPPPPVASGRFSGLEDQRVAGLQPSSTMAGSRFSSPPAVASPVAPAFSQAEPSTTSAASRFSQMPSSPGSPEASFRKTQLDTEQSTSATTSSQESPITAPQSHPLLENPMQVPPVPPTSRRPDPGYRPGGTSSYQPASPIIVHSTDPEQQLETIGERSDSGQDIAPASFEAQLGSPRMPE
ncbi:hypothetical protein N9U65_04275 [Planctomycetaceae bacterium]|nr:hypothetical protein [Planctomycetaceae bacterium]